MSHLDVRAGGSQLRLKKFRIDKKSRKWVSVFISLKKSSSVNKFNIKTKLIVISVTNTREFKNVKIINFVYTFMLFELKFFIKD